MILLLMILLTDIGIILHVLFVNQRFEQKRVIESARNTEQQS